MIKNQSLEDIIKSKLSFTFGSAKGWLKIYCEVCGDGSRTKGPRGGWLFEGSRIFYHCFNRGCSANYDSDRDIPFSKEMYNVLEKFGISKQEYMSVLPLKKTSTGIKPSSPEIKSKTLDLPDYFIPMSEVGIDNDTVVKAKQFLKEHYDLSLNSYTYYMSTGVTNGGMSEEITAKCLLNRIIIPYFKGDSLVYWQARALDETSTKPYINADTGRSNVIFGFNKLYENTNQPLYVVEGVFDAINLDGVGVMENNLTSQQIDILNKSPRTKVVVPDMKGDSHKLAEQAIDLGWSVALPNMGGCKDVSETILKYGRMHLFNEIVNNISNGKIAKIKLSLKR